MSTFAVALRVNRRAIGTRMPFLVAFAAAALAAGLGRAVATTYLPYLLDRIADNPGLIGMVMLVNAAAGVAVPLVVGVWSDRRGRRGHGRRLPFLLGGSLVTAGGLVAIALGSSTSYIVLALFAAIVYTGLNALTTAHRALIPELFDDSGRARATSAQELAMLGGGLVGLAVGGLLTGLAPWAPFALAAVLVPLLTLPTLARTPEPDQPESAPSESRPAGYYLRAASRPGVRGFLLAQILWVLGYAALPSFFLLYADDVLGLQAGEASLTLAGFGLATGLAIAAAGRVRNPAMHRPLLLLGVVLLGGGFVAVAASTQLLWVALGLVVAATGFGLISVVGFPLFSELIPEGEAGGYTALYFSVRSISSALALPAAGWTVHATGSYRALFVFGGLATLGALVPLMGLRRPSRRSTVVALLASAPVVGLLVAFTEAQRLDEWGYQIVNGLGPGPEIVWTILDPHMRNYLVLLGIATVAAAVGRAGVTNVVSRVLGSAVLASGLLLLAHATWNRPRPEEVLDASQVTLNGHNWAHLHSFPSGHMVVTAALAVSIALAFPRLRFLMWAYIAAVAVSRVLFGAHFPFDVIAGTAVGIASALLVASAFERLRRQRAEDGSTAAYAPAALEPSTVVAVMPSYDDVPEPALVDEVLDHVGGLILVDDGSSPAVAAQLDELAATRAAELVRLPANRGKGSAVRAGIAAALEREPAPEAVLVIDADGQHPAAAIPAFLAAGGTAELVIGDRFGDLGEMPLVRRLANRSSRLLLQLSTGREVRDTQNGMRLLRGRAPESFPGGGYEAETRHLKRALKAGLSVAWVPMPAVYAGEQSSFRAGRDSARVLWALLGPSAPSRLSPARSLLRERFRRAHLRRSARLDRPVTAPRARRAPAAAA